MDAGYVSGNPHNVLRLFNIVESHQDRGVYLTVVVKVCQVQSLRESAAITEPPMEGPIICLKVPVYSGIGVTAHSKGLGSRGQSPVRAGQLGIKGPRTEIQEILDLMVEKKYEGIVLSENYWKRLNTKRMSNISRTIVLSKSDIIMDKKS